MLIVRYETMYLLVVPSLLSRKSLLQPKVLGHEGGFASLLELPVSCVDS